MRAAVTRLMVPESGCQRPRKHLRLVCDIEAVLEAFVADHGHPGSCCCRLKISNIPGLTGKRDAHSRLDFLQDDCLQDTFLLITPVEIRAGSVSIQMLPDTAHCH